MQTNITRLQFIISFVGMDLPNIRPGDLLNLREDLADFLGHGPTDTLLQCKGAILAHPKMPPLTDITLQDLEALQAELRTILDSIVMGDDRAPRYKTVGNETVGRLLISPPITLLPIKASYALVTDGVRRRPGEGTYLSVMGPTRDMVLLTTLWLLNAEGTDRIVPCPACQAVFYRVGRQRYCSNSCRNRVAGKQWREREGNAEKNREKAHAHYKAKQTAAGSATVQRRPRKRQTVPTPA